MRAVVAGESSDGGPLYVGRAHHEGGLYPGKVNPDHNCCYIAYGGAELSKEEFDVNIYQQRNRNTPLSLSLSPQILVAPRNCDLAWVDASNGHIPTGAVQGGYNDSNDPLYIGRASVEDSLAVGKVRSTDGVLIKLDICLSSDQP